MVSQLRALHFLRRQYTVQHQAQEVVAEHNKRNLPAGEVPDAVRRPSNLGPELLPGQGARVQEGRGGTAGHVIAGEGKDFEKKRKAK